MVKRQTGPLYGVREVTFPLIYIIGTQRSVGLCAVTGQGRVCQRPCQTPPSTSLPTIVNDYESLRSVTSSKGHQTFPHYRNKSPSDTITVLNYFLARWIMWQRWGLPVSISASQLITFWLFKLWALCGGRGGGQKCKAVVLGYTLRQDFKRTKIFVQKVTHRIILCYTVQFGKGVLKFRMYCCLNFQNIRLVQIELYRYLRSPSYRDTNPQYFNFPLTYG